MVQTRRGFSRIFGYIAQGGIEGWIINIFYLFYGFVNWNVSK